MQFMKHYLGLVMMASILYLDFSLATEVQPIVNNGRQLRQKHKYIPVINDSFENKEKHQDFDENPGSPQCQTIVWAMCNEIKSRHEDD